MRGLWWSLWPGVSRCLHAALSKRTLKRPAFLFSVHQQPSPSRFPPLSSSLCTPACTPARTPAPCPTPRAARNLDTASNTPPVRAPSAMVSPLSPRCPPFRTRRSSPRFTRRRRVIGPKPYVSSRLSMRSIFPHALADARARPLARESCGSVLWLTFGATPTCECSLLPRSVPALLCMLSSSRFATGQPYGRRFAEVVGD